MTTAAVLIQDAFREGNLIPVGKQPTADEQAEALRRLNAYINGIFGSEMGENLSDWLVPAPQRTAAVAANYPQLPYKGDPPESVYTYPPKNSRIVLSSTLDERVYFPEAPDDGSRMALIAGAHLQDGVVVTLDGNGRLIEGVTEKPFVAPLTARQWLYRADLGEWRAVVDLVLTDDCPFPKELDDLFITALNIRLSPRYGKEISAGTLAAYKALLKTMKARYRQAGVTTFGSENIPTARQSYGADWYR